MAGNITSNVGLIGNVSVLADAVNKLPGDLTGNILSATSIGNIVVAGDITSKITATGGNIGAITGTGTGDQTLQLTTVAGTGTIGALTFNTLANTKTLDLTVTNAITIGAISVNNATALTTGDLKLTGGAALTTVGNLTVDGKVTLNNSLGAVITMGKIDVGSFDAIGGALTVGAGGVGSNVGYILIADTDTASTNTVNFQFRNWTTVAGVVTAANVGLKAVVGIVEGPTNLDTGGVLAPVGTIANAAGQTSNELTFIYA